MDSHNQNVRRLLLTAFIAVGALLFSEATLYGDRVAVVSQNENGILFSIAVPRGWILKPGKRDSAGNERFSFVPLRGAYPYFRFTCEPRNEAKLATELATADKLTRGGFLDSDETATTYFDSGRKLTWIRSRTGAIDNIRVTLFGDRTIQFQFVNHAQIHSGFEETVVKVIDSIDFNAIHEDANRTTSAGLVGMKDHLGAEQEEFEFVLTVWDEPSRAWFRYIIATLAVTVTGTLLVIERRLRRRQMLEKIEEADEAMRARKEGREPRNRFTLDLADDL